VEPALVTVGDDLNTVAQFLEPGRSSYGAADVVKSLLSLVAEPVAAEETAAEAELPLAAALSSS
jgi:nitronate monooxygenase